MMQLTGSAGHVGCCKTAGSSRRSERVMILQSLFRVVFADADCVPVVLDVSRIRWFVLFHWFNLLKDAC